MNQNICSFLRDNNTFIQKNIKITNMKGQIIQALKDSLIGDTLTLQQSNAKLSQFAKKQGYCMCLMEIIDEPAYDIPLKQAALIQLKNNIKAKWKPKNDKIELTAGQKNTIRNALVLAVIRCAKNHMLIKLYREILTTIVGFEFQTWIPLQDILTRLHAGENLAPVFQCIIAICTNFQFSVMEKERLIYTQFLKEVLPPVLENVKKNLGDAELIYLSLKILWKAIHYEIEKDIKALANNWMQLILLTITAYNENMQKNLDEIQIKNTEEFYYYHSKKWATRILMRFIQKHAKAYTYGKINQQNVEYSKFWYENYGIKLCEAIVTHLFQAIPTIKKIRYFQLKIIQGIISDRPQLISQQAKTFQYDILLKYMFLTQEDETLAKDDVIEYLRNDDDMSTTFSNIKKAATEVWNSFMQLGSKHDRDNNVYQPGPLFEENMQFILSKISSSNLLEKELGMYLFCENRITINRVPSIRQKVPELLQKYVVPELTNSAILIRSRANDMFYEYGKEIKDFNIITKAIQGIFKCMTQDESALVRIKAAIALNPIISHQDSKKLLEPYLKTILQVYLKLIEQYDLEQLVSALEYFISDFSQSIGPFAVDLFKYLSGIFIKMFNKEIQMCQNQQYGSEIQLAASGCLKTMTQIIESPLKPQVRAKLQPCVLDICAFLFTNESLDYTEDLMYMIRVHVEKVDKITPACWFFYQVIIYFIAGLPNDLWNHIENLPLPESHKQILANIRSGNNIQFIEYAIPVLRNYFGKGYQMIVAQKQEFRTNFIHLVFYLVGHVYRKGPTGSEYEGEIYYDCCSILLVYLMQTFPPEMTKPVILSVWNIAKFNLIKGKSPYLKQITCQMLCVLLWRHPIQFLQVVLKQNQLQNLIKQIKEVGGKLEEPQQRKRTILGICTYFNVMHQNLETFGTHAPTLFKVLIKLVKKNCRSKIILNTNEQNLKKALINMSDSQDSEEEKINEDDYDDQDMWDEEYNQKNVSLLRKVNQLAYFKETIQKMSNQIPKVYSEIISTIQPQKLNTLQQFLDQAINLIQK